MSVTPDNPGEAVSAVKALSKAAAEGQRIYHITPANQYEVLPSIHHNAETMNQIRDALAAGKEVITHTDDISVPGWSGAGYVIYDPGVGDGAWKIGGGQNGGWFTMLSVAIVSLMSIFLPFIAVSLFVLYGFFVLAALFTVTVSLALYYGPDFDTYRGSIEWMSFIASTLGVMKGYTLLAKLLGSRKYQMIGFLAYLAGVIGIGIKEMNRK